MDHFGRILKLQAAVEALQKQVALTKQLHLQFVTVVTVAAKGHLILTQADFAAAKGHALYMATDPVTGDLVMETHREDAPQVSRLPRVT